MHALPLQWSIDIKSVGHAPAVFTYEASSAELEALKRYVEVEDLTSFKAQVKIVPLAAGKYRASGKLQASAVQSSVVNLRAVPSSIEESFSVEYWPAESIENRGEEAAPFDAEPPEPIAGGKIPVGGLLCELLAVSIDPYPRNEGDAFEWTPPEPETEANPFAGLAHLRARKPPKDD